MRDKINYMRDKIIQELQSLGYSTIPSGFYRLVDKWRSWYVGNVNNFSHYTIKTGEDTISCKRYSLGMAKKLAEDWANLLLNEKVALTLEGKKEQEFIDTVFSRNNFLVRANEMQELKSALGTVAYIPRVVGFRGDGRATGIMLDCVTIDSIFPLSWHNGEIDECAFTSTVIEDGKSYLYLILHIREENGFYKIENRIYSCEGESLKEVELASVKRFELIPRIVHTGSDRRQFVIDRLNIANNFDHTLPVGVSVYANAIDILKGIDIAYDSYVNEFNLGKKRIMVKPSATKFLDGNPVFDHNDTVYYVLPEDSNDESVITPIDMTLRTAEHNRGIQDQLNFLASKCGLGETYYRFDGGSIATATQVISENSSMFRAIRKHETILRSVLEELCRIILRLGNSAMGAALDENVKISVNFDDSIIVDTEQERAQDRLDVSMGAMNLWEYRSKYYNEDEDTAKSMLPKMDDLVS